MADQTDRAAVRHNRRTSVKTGPMVGPDIQGNICLLASDGRLFGPFKSRSDAIYWADTLGIASFGTYDLLPPFDPDQRPESYP